MDAVRTKKSKQRWIPVKFFKDKVQCSWALEAKSEFNLEMYRNQRSFWTMVVLLKFRILKFNSCTLDGSGEAMVEAGGQPSSGKTSFTIMLTKFVQNMENLRNGLGIFSCLLQTWHVKRTNKLISSLGITKRSFPLLFMFSSNDVISSKNWIGLWDNFYP